MMGLRSPRGEYRSSIDMAVSYLVGNYNPHIGLIYESEDKGYSLAWVLGYFLDTEWLYSDNLEALHVLEKVSNQSCTENILRLITVTSYQKIPTIWDILFGENIPDDIRHAENIAVVNTSELVVIYGHVKEITKNLLSTINGQIRFVIGP